MRAIDFDRETLSHPSRLLTTRTLNTAYRLGFERGAKWAAQNPTADLPPIASWADDAPPGTDLGLTPKQVARPGHLRAAIRYHVYGCVSGAEQPRISASLRGTKTAP